jgi:NAD(P)-dependent dehydrogenase (short-subunit alcohol dehydrogenase family)
VAGTEAERGPARKRRGHEARGKGRHRDRRSEGYRARRRESAGREGATLVVVDVNADGAQEAANELAEAGQRSMSVAVNVADPASVAAMMRSVLCQFQRVDILINNAGDGGNTPFLDTTLEEWNRIIGVNLTGAFLVAQACAHEMVKTDGGKIVNIASLSGQHGGHGRAAYGAAKAGLPPPYS